MKKLIDEIETIKFSWDNLMRRVKGEPRLSEEVFLNLVTAYCQADRYYHNLRHIQQVLEIVEEMRSLANNFLEIQLSVWFHDVIYDSRAKDNEENSAAYAGSTLRKFKIPLARIERIKNMILNTKTHQAQPGDIDSQILLDADLSILGSPQSDYRAYAQAIRQEYAWVSDEQYRVGRKQVLQNFLSWKRIYFTEQLFTKLETQARWNMQAEIASLS
ncbi:MAG: hypothetical protein AB4426_09825 [Xenococcaceae cyanobacterium]